MRRAPCWTQKTPAGVVLMMTLAMAPVTKTTSPRPKVAAVQVRTRRCCIASHGNPTEPLIRTALRGSSTKESINVDGNNGSSMMRRDDCVCCMTRTCQPALHVAASAAVCLYCAYTLLIWRAMCGSATSCVCSSPAECDYASSPEGSGCCSMQSPTASRATW